jgi:hypothetical protein
VESALSKLPLDWMITEAKEAGLRINSAMRNHLVLGRERQGSAHQHVTPDPNGTLHDSMTWGWRPLEWIPKNDKWTEDADRCSIAGWYLPRGEPRPIPNGARIHYSVITRQKGDLTYRPPNLPACPEAQRA